MTLTITATGETGCGQFVFWHYVNDKITELKDANDDTAGHQILLEIGDKLLEVSVNIGNKFRDYKLTITRQKPTVSIKTLTSSPAQEGDKIQFEISRSAAATDNLTVTGKGY